MVINSVINTVIKYELLQNKNQKLFSKFEKYVLPISTLLTTGKS